MQNKSVLIIIAKTKYDNKKGAATGWLQPLYIKKLFI